MPVQKADRLKALPPYLFVEIDRKKRQALAEGKDVINLGIGDPDQPTPSFIIEAMQRAVPDPANHRYPLDEGIPEFRAAAAEWLQHRFEVDLDPDKEILTLIGSKEGLAHLPLAVINPGDVVLVPQPAYPVYQAASIFAGATVHHMPLREETGWLVDLDAIPPEVLSKTKLMYLNYPNNPTAAVAPLSFFERAVALAKQHDFLIAQDAAYSELYFDDRPASILQVPGAKDVAVEFHSLSKTFNMTGWRLGFAAGNGEAIANLAQVKSNVDSGQFNAIQWAGLEALHKADHPAVKAMLDLYRERRDALVEGLQAAGIKVRKPAATFYVWAACPDGYDSLQWATTVLEQAAVVVIPGVGFGRAGEGYFRCALTVDTDRIREACQRIAGIKR